MSSSFVESTKKFVEAADWLEDEDAPAVQSLQAAATQLDKELNPALLGQYRLFYAALVKKKPVIDVSTDPLDNLLKRGKETA